MSLTPPADSSLFVQSFARGLGIIEAFDREHDAMTLSEAAARAGLSRATARRLLHTLVELGYAAESGGHFSLTPKVLGLGWGYLAQRSVPQLALPVLRRLSAELGESCSLAVLDGTDVLYVQRVQTRRIMHVDITVGTRFPAAWTSMGRVLLSELAPDAARGLIISSLPHAPGTAATKDPEALLGLLEAVRTEGFCLVDQELEAGLRSVAVPVRDGEGRVDHALNVSLSTARGEVPASALERVLPALRAAAAEVERARAAVGR